MRAELFVAYGALCG